MANYLLLLAAAFAAGHLSAPVHGTVDFLLPDLMDVTGHFDAPTPGVLSVLSLVAMSISIACMSTGAILLMFLRSASTNGKIVTVYTLGIDQAICCSMLAGNVLFLAGQLVEPASVGCHIAAGLALFFYTAMFFFMAAANITTALVVWKGMEGADRILRLGAHTALVLVLALTYAVAAVAAAATTNNSGGFSNPHRCWFSSANGYVWLVAAPAIASVAVGFVPAVYTVTSIVQHAKAPAQADKKKPETDVGKVLRGLVKVFTRSGLLMVFGVLVFNDAMAYIFLFAFTLQSGLFLFVAVIDRADLREELTKGVEKVRRASSATFYNIKERLSVPKVSPLEASETGRKGSGCGCCCC